MEPDEIEALIAAHAPSGDGRMRPLAMTAVRAALAREERRIERSFWGLTVAAAVTLLIALGVAEDSGAMPAETVPGKSIAAGSEEPAAPVDGRGASVNSNSLAALRRELLRGHLP